MADDQDYVFERSTEFLTRTSIERSVTAKLKLEAYYKNIMDLTIEREKRRLELETRLEKDPGSLERKNRQLENLGRKESNFLRLRRTKLGLDDFITVKVIGKGAFGEVPLTHSSLTGLGETCAKGGHGQDLRHENAPQGGNVQKGPGMCAELTGDVISWPTSSRSVTCLQKQTRHGSCRFITRSRIQIIFI
jgi:hypothetical protein